jgi:hypothetical protein
MSSGFARHFLNFSGKPHEVRRYVYGDGQGNPQLCPLSSREPVTFSICLCFLHTSGMFFTPPQSRHPERSAAQNYRHNGQLMRGVEGPRRRLLADVSSELSSHELRAKLKKSQAPSAAEGSAVLRASLGNVFRHSIQMRCHPDRSEAQWRDLLFASSATTPQETSHSPLCHPERSRGICGYHTPTTKPPTSHQNRRNPEPRKPRKPSRSPPHVSRPPQRLPLGHEP